MPIGQDASQWTSRRDRYGPLTSLCLLRQDIFQINKFFFKKRHTQGHKQAMSHSCGVQTDHKVPKGKCFAQTGGDGGLLGRTPSTHSVKSSAAPSEASLLLSTESESRLRARSGEGQRKFWKLTIQQLLAQPCRSSSAFPAALLSSSQRELEGLEPQGSDSCLDAQHCPPAQAQAALH